MPRSPHPLHIIGRSGPGGARVYSPWREPLNDYAAPFRCPETMPRTASEKMASAIVS